jgi:hypothetical protein
VHSKAFALKLADHQFADVGIIVHHQNAAVIKAGSWRKAGSSLGLSLPRVLVQPVTRGPYIPIQRLRNPTDDRREDKFLRKNFWHVAAQKSIALHASFAPVRPPHGLPLAILTVLAACSGHQAPPPAPDGCRLCRPAGHPGRAQHRADRAHHRHHHLRRAPAGRRHHPRAPVQGRQRCEGGSGAL